MTEDELYDMSDEDLEVAANAERNSANAEDENDNSDNEPDVVDDGSTDEVDSVEGGDPENSDDNTDEVEEDEPNDEVDEEDVDTSESDEGQPDGEPASDEDETDTPETDTPTQEFAPLKVSGKNIPINSLDELYTLASGGASVTQKFQEIAGHKKSISIMQEHGLTEADLSMLIEARNGNKDALASLVKQSGIDSLDVTDEVSEGYQPGQYIPSDQQMNLHDVQSLISQDEEYGTTQNIVNNLMDERSQNTLVQNPNMIRGLHEDVKSGAYERVSAHAQKLKLMDGGIRSDMDYYVQAAQEGPQGQQPQQQVPATQIQEPAPKAKPDNKDKKRAAGSTHKATKTPSIKEIEDLSDDELMAYREKIMAQV